MMNVLYLRYLPQTVGHRATKHQQCITYIHENYKPIELEAGVSLSLNGLIQFEIKGHKPELRRDLPILSKAILAIVALLVTVFLNSASTSGRAIGSISVKWKTQLYFCFAAGTSRRRREILYARKPIGESIRRHNHEKNEGLARILN